MRRLVAIAAVVGCLAAATPARSQNDWQFPDPYFGALEFDASRPAPPRPRRIEPPPPRSKAQRSRPFRGRPRWSAQTQTPRP